MNARVASAVFDSQDEAQRAVSDLREAGIPDSAISVIGRHDGDGGDDDGVNKSGALKGALGGAAVGTVLGIAALAIPGVGPHAAAGAIAATAIPDAAAIGAAVGAGADQRPLHSMDQLHVSPGRNHPVLTETGQPFQ